MKPASIGAGIVFLFCISFVSAPAYAGRGGGPGGGGGSGAMSAGGGAGGRAVVPSGGGRAMGGMSAARVSGMRAYSAGAGSRVYANGGRIYSARQVNSVYGGNVIRSATVRNSTVKGSVVHQARSTHLAAHPMNGNKQTASTLKSSTLNSRAIRANRLQSETNRIHHAGAENQSRKLNATGAMGKKGGLAAGAISARPGKLARNNPANKNRFGAQTQSRLRNWQGKKSDFAEASRRHKGGGNHHHNGHCHHDHDWWHHHCASIILIDSGWWGWWDGWWYPAWGYDPYYSAYDYDGPIYDYGGLPPDEMVANVQAELQRLGYFSYAADGVLGPLTQDALMRYQRDHRIPVTGTVDPTTVGSLGLSSSRTFTSTSG